jgi:hypothetical protein
LHFWMRARSSCLRAAVCGSSLGGMIRLPSSTPMEKADKMKETSALGCVGQVTHVPSTQCWPYKNKNRLIFSDAEIQLGTAALLHIGRANPINRQCVPAKL